MTSIKSHITITPKELRLLSSGNDLVFFREADDDNFLKTIYKEMKMGYSKFYKMDGLSRLGFLGAEFLLQNEIEKENCDLLFINKHASLAVDKSYQESLATIASPALFVYTLPNIVQGEICIRHKIHGENYTFVEKDFTTESIFEKANTILQNSALNSLLVACLNYIGDENYELIMFLVVKNSDNQAIKFNLQELNNIFGTQYK